MNANDVTDLLRELLLLYGPGLLDLGDTFGVRTLHSKRTGLLVLTIGGRQFRITVTEHQAGGEGDIHRLAG